ncbi:MAG: hypothetical protein Q7R33_05065 [Nitrosarchaeum sp.]|nr:hypothetical protein [Nitrosarchaeum sp.]
MNLIEVKQKQDTVDIIYNNEICKSRYNKIEVLSGVGPLPGTYYANISLVSTGGDGSINNPWGWTEFYASITTSSFNTYYLKGMFIGSSSLSTLIFSRPATIKGWDINVNGPWRLVHSDAAGGTPLHLGFSDAGHIDIRDGIIYAVSIYVQGPNFTTVEFLNCTVKLFGYAMPAQWLAPSNTATSHWLKFVDCYFEKKGHYWDIENQGLGPNFSMTVIFHNSVVVLDALGISSISSSSEGVRAVEFINCTTNAVNGSAVATNGASFSDDGNPSQFSWPEVGLPSYDALQAAWKQSVIGAGITRRSVASPITYGLWGEPRNNYIGAFYFDVNDYRLYLTQGANRHVIKRLHADVTPAVYDGRSYGNYGEIGELKYPNGIAGDSDNIFLCDYKNQNIKKLSLILDLTDTYDTQLTCDKPYLIQYDSQTADLYILGITPNFWNMKFERITTDLVQVKISDYLGKMSNGLMPTGFCRGFTTSDFLVCGLGNDLFRTIESSTTFSAFTAQTISYMQPTRYTGIVKHTNGDLYLNTGTSIIRVNSSFEKIGESNKIGIPESLSPCTTYGLKINHAGDLLIYNADTKTVLKYSEKLNFVEEVFPTTGSLISNDASSIGDFIEVGILQ